MNPKKIEEIIETYQKKTTGEFGIAFLDLESGFSASIKEDHIFPAASVFKVFVLAEFFRRVTAGDFSLDERLELTADMKVLGSGLLRHMRPGMALTLYDYAYLMMSYSDNTATEIIIKLVGLEQVKSNILDAFSFNDTKIDFNIRELLANTYYKKDNLEIDKYTGKPTYRNGEYFTCKMKKNNQTTPKDLVRFFKLMYDGLLPNTEAARQSIDLMKLCGTQSRIPARLPFDVQIAHKTGSLGRLANDAGIVYTAKGNYILAALYNGNVADYDEYCDNFRNMKGADLISHLSQEIYDAYLEG